MPFQPGQANKFKKGLSSQQEEKWASIANSVLEQGQSETSAIRQASGSIKQPGKLQAAAQRKLKKTMHDRRLGF